MKPSLARNFLLVFAGTFAVLLVTNWTYYFHAPFHEQGDAALNALQINQAKGFHELYGNYSRFRFHHPGPVFFYVYAWAEMLLCDTLKLSLSPYNAHSLAGLAVQVGFFSLALSIAAQWVKARLFLPLALLVAAIHFAIAGNAFWSIWPPHVLLMPFLAFWLACLSMACGRGEHLVWVVLTGSMLVHGHVAQPLFVICLSSLSYGLLHFQNGNSDAGKKKPRKRDPHAHWIAALVILVFCAPLVLDLFRGNESNLAEIFRHIHDNTEQTKKPLKALLYVISFFGYAHNQDEVLRELSPESLTFFSENWQAFCAWIAILLAAIFSLRHLRLGSEPESRFWKTGVRLWLATIVLGLVWAIVQTGRMYEFNSYFFYAITYLVALPPAAWLAHKLQLTSSARVLAWVFPLTAALAAAWLFSKSPLSAGESGLPYLDTVRIAVNSDPLPGRPKLLAFDQQQWPQAATVALALERLGENYYVDDPWWFMFSRQRTVPDAILCQAQPDISVWHLLPSHETDKDELVGDGVTLVDEVPQLTAQGGMIDFAHNENYTRFVATGFSNLFGNFAWLCQENALLQFHPELTTQDVELDLAVVPYFPPEKHALPPLEIFFNGQRVLHTTVTQSGHLLCHIPQTLWSKYPVATLRLYLPGAHNPFEPGLSNDHAFGSLSIRRLTTRQSIH